VADEIIEMGTIRGGDTMGNKKGGSTLAGRVSAAQRAMAHRAGLAGGFARPGFGNLRASQLSGFAGKSMMAGLIPNEVKPVPVIVGTVVGVGLNSAAARLLESPKVGINANPLLARSGLAVVGVIAHALLRTNFSLGLMIGQFPALVDAGVSALMDMVLGETTALRGASAASMGRISQEALSELQSLRKRLDATTPASSASVPMGVRAKAAA
jgi:hypothetical protein